MIKTFNTARVSKGFDETVNEFLLKLKRPYQLHVVGTAGNLIVLVEYDERCARDLRNAAN